MKANFDEVKQNQKKDMETDNIDLTDDIDTGSDTGVLDISSEEGNILSQRNREL